MDHERVNRQLSNRFIHHFMHAVEEQMGTYCLHMLLRQSGMERYIQSIPPDDDRNSVSSSEYAAFHKSLRDYYGLGARGSLIRIGQITFDNLYNEQSLISKGRSLTLKALPVESRREKMLDYLADVLQKPKGIRSVFTLDKELIFVDPYSDATFNIQSTTPICWTTLGLIREAILLSTGAEHDVEEIACRAMGEESCKYRISI